MDIGFLIAGPGAALFFTIVGGFLVSRLGRPYSQGLLAVHKLIALTAIVFDGFFFIPLLQADPGNVLGLVSLMLMVSSLLGLIVTGSVLGALKQPSLSLHVVHIVVTVVAVTSFIFTIVFFS